MIINNLFACDFNTNGSAIDPQTGDLISDSWIKKTMMTISTASYIPTFLTLTKIMDLIRENKIEI
jgi:hypothetical protein